LFVIVEATLGNSSTLKLPGCDFALFSGSEC